MTENTCPFGPTREDTLVGYVYGELPAAEQAAFERHLPACPICRLEVESFAGVREQLTRWAPPELGDSVAPLNAMPPLSLAPRAAPREAPPARSWWADVPAWAQAAAALLVVSAALGAANLDIRYDSTGLRVRTGWGHQDEARAGAGAPAVASAPASQPTTAAPTPVVPATVSFAPGEAPWKADLAALERQLRSDLRAEMGRATRVSATPVASGDADEATRRMRAMLDEHDKKQQRELALRVAEVVRDVDAQRRADLVKIDRSIGQIQSNTGVEVLRQRELLNYLVRASQKQQ